MALEDLMCALNAAPHPRPQSTDTEATGLAKGRTYSLLDAR
jgi:hypothetical protein